MKTSLAERKNLLVVLAGLTLFGPLSAVVKFDPNVPRTVFTAPELIQALPESGKEGLQFAISVEPQPMSPEAFQIKQTGSNQITIIGTDASAAMDGGLPQLRWATGEMPPRPSNRCNANPIAPSSSPADASIRTCPGMCPRNTSTSFRSMKSSSDHDLGDVPSLGRTVTAGKSNYVDQVIAAGLHQEAIRGYRATTAYAAAQIGHALQALEHSAYRDNTIVVLISDHGFHLGEKNHWQKGTLWEESTHCLMMMRVPGITSPRGTSKRFVSRQDIYPTLAELARLEPPAYLDGRSLRPLSENPDATWASTAITAFDDQYVSIRTEQFRSIRYSDDQGELHDHQSDRHEWRNQMSNPKYQATLTQLRNSVPALASMSEPMPFNKQQ